MGSVSFISIMSLRLSGMAAVTRPAPVLSAVMAVKAAAPVIPGRAGE